MKIFANLLAGAVIFGGLAGWAQADFINGDLAVLQITGAGSATAAAPVSIVYYDPSGNKVQTLALPSSGAAAVTLEQASDNHDGHLNLSANGQYLLFAGYRANAGDPDPSAATAASVNRVIVRIDGNGNVDASTALTDAYDNTQITSVVSVDGNEFWTAGSGSYSVSGNTYYTTTGGLRYVSALGATTTTNLSQTQTTPGNPQPDSYRSVRIQTDVEGGLPVSKLYLSSASQGSFTNRGAFTTAITLPTSDSQTIVPIINGTENSGVDPSEKLEPKSDVIFLDLDPTVAGFDTAYGTGGKADYEKWSLVGGNWVMESSTMLSDKSKSINALDYTLSGSTVTLYATTDGGIFKLTDTSGYGAPISASFPSTYFITADSGMEFRGIAVLTPEPASLTLFGLGAAALLIRGRRVA